MRQRGIAFGMKHKLAGGSLMAGLLLGLVSPTALAATEVVPLERLHVHDVILLPTVRSQYVARFTKPTTWQVAPSSQVVVEFQHSHELLPNRSWLQIIVNDKVVKHVPLTHANENGTRLTVPLPVGLLKDFNTLAFRVEQHYADKCEDPLDKSLWTQILPPTQIIFNYTPTVPQVSLAGYPYPIIDPLTYSPAKVHYVTSAQASQQELQALAFVNVHLAQQAQIHEIKTRVSFEDQPGPANEHVVFVGKGSTIPDAAKYQASFGDYALQGGQWMNRRTGQTLGNDQGLILFFQAPGSAEHTVLVVTGNSDQAVIKAAEYLTTRPKESTLLGNALEVPPGWSASGARGSKVSRFIESSTRSFQELGFTIQEVQKINAPPITYHVPIVGDFRNQNGKLWLDLHYSYSPQLNPEFSSLELRMNDVSIANIPLTNPNGETDKHFSVQIPNELIKVRNDLVAQFHLEPDKHGWCVDNYVDNSWGKIMDNSALRVEGGVSSRMPDLGLLNNTMYPYSKEDNLQAVHLVVPKDPTPQLLEAMLGFTTRLGRSTLADTNLRLALSKGFENVAGDRHVAVFRNSSDALNLPDGAHLLWKPGEAAQSLLRMLGLADINNAQVAASQAELGHGIYMEQYLNGSRAISVFTASEPAGFQALGNLFETDQDFETLQSGYLQQASLLNRTQINPLNAITYHLEKQKSGGSGWFGWLEDLRRWAVGLPWMQIIFGMVAVFFIFLILPVVVQRIFRK
ncbi:MAG TPA: cellulose biosynthesis cyclic di-GMP-binding regulatory protein BcsB [Coleofasciculaceae cyanobacterium]